MNKYSGRRTIAIMLGGAAASWGLVALAVDLVWMVMRA